MILKNGDYKQLADRIKTGGNKVIVYGAGMIGQIIIPHLISKYNIADNIDCFIDADPRKEGQSVTLGDYSYEIKTPDYLHKKHEKTILLITNSKFFPVIKFLDGIKELDDVEGYIIPMMQIYELQHAEAIQIEKYSDQPLIPKIINYCWFGKKEMSPFLQKCIASWRNFCPDYEIICWNEDNYDVNKYTFTKQAYEQKKYGFVTDLARLDILYEHGGIYMDTDVTLVKILDDMLFQEGFTGVEKWGNINTGGGCGFVPGHPMLKEMIDYRKQYSFVLEDGSLNIETNGMYETKPFLLHGFNPDNSLQRVNGVTVYPPYVLHPYDYMSCELHEKTSTYSIHYFYGGWMEEDDRLNRTKTQDAYMEIVYRVNNGGLPL